MYIKALFGLLLLSVTIVSVAGPNDIIVYSDIKGQYEDFASDFRVIATKAVDRLDRFEAITVSANFLPVRSSLSDRIKSASRNGIPWLADVTLTSEKKKVLLKVEIYNTKKNEIVFRWKENYTVRSIKSLLAQLEYKLPLQLKNRFLEIGRVIKKDKRVVYFDLGDTAGIKVGEIYEIYEEGMEIEDEKGNSYGFLEEVKGVIKVINVTGVYSVGEIIIGQLAIKPEQYVKKIHNAKESKYRGEILAVLENQVAINIGKQVGVKEGAFYAVYRDIMEINNQESFRVPVGHIKINEVFENFAKGELSISETYTLAKHTIRKGDLVEEVESPRKNMWSLNQVITNINGADSGRIPYFAYQRDSAVNVNLVYRVKMGYGSDYFFAAGVMQSIEHSSHVFAGIDLIYLDGTALNLFVSMDIDTPLSGQLKFNMESGYTVSASSAKYSGINTSLGFKYGFDLF